MREKSKAIKVTLREKPMKDGMKSLYLDFYPAVKDFTTGKDTRREFLGLYIYTPIKTTARGEIYAKDKDENEFRKNQNEDNLKKADNIRHIRQNQFDKPEIYNELERKYLHEKAKSETLFLPYFKTLADKRKSSNADNWISAYKYLLQYNADATFADVDIYFCEGFKDFLFDATKGVKGKKLAQNSISSYFNKFKATLKQAYKEGFLKTDINASVPSVPAEETKREFLTVQELNELIKTECEDPILKRAALFSALTGLRHIDILQMTWKEVVNIENQGWFIDYRQQKTHGKEFEPISDDAYNLLGTRQNDNDVVFKGLAYSAWHNIILAKWIMKADIKKNITFHCFRHTFATLQLANGTDIYTVSKMLGHKDLKTTQIYAKIIDATKRAAADKIKLDF